LRSETLALLTAAALLGSAGCEETVPLEGLPYVERPVIAARVVEGMDTVLLSVTRTLPTTVAYDASAAAVVDAGVILRSDGTDYAAVHQGSGRYAAGVPRIAAGATFALDFTWSGRRVTAQTFVPAPAQVGSSALLRDSSAYTLRSVLLPRPAETYCQSWAIRGPAGRMLAGGTFTVALEGSGTGDSLTLTESYSSLPLQQGDTLYAVVHAFDNQFTAYFASRGANRSGHDDLVFSEAGGSVRWNVQGDGIGMFIGTSLALRPVWVQP
jgi:hypothetical protein